MCGGTTSSAKRAGRPRGLSPRVRGNLLLPGTMPASGRTIPACAGEPIVWAGDGQKRRDYPRVCGGTQASGVRPACIGGLSPRVRGNPASTGFSRSVIGTIPACAGEPTALRGWAPSAWDYPRVCGGTTAATAIRTKRTGLSPRVRGNHAAAPSIALAGGTIPACAGEPRLLPLVKRLPEDYPRVCGGTKAGASGCATADGLSPRVRGNRTPPACYALTAGTIPACAGEPGVRTTGMPSPADYPRVCGGTSFRGQGITPTNGLSPRVRGNPGFGLAAAGSFGTIPACAGEPRTRERLRGLRTDYPRVCGGTHRVLRVRVGIGGLSPRVRGNPAALPSDTVRGGTIPACAGEPVR